MRRVLGLACLVLVCQAASATAATSSSAAEPAGLTAPTPDARAWLVVNATTGDVLAHHAEDQEAPIASITKLMTVIVVLQHLKLTQVVRVDPRAAAVGQESIELAPGEEMTVGDLLKGALIQSANDAADALALATAPSFEAFAVMMNDEAKLLGLDHSHFVRPDGLDAPDEYSSARDVTTLAEDAMRDPVIRDTVSQETATISGDRTLHTWNNLLGVVPGVIGVKTGHTSGAGWGQVTAVNANGMRLYVTILGSPSESQRDNDLERLIAYGLAHYRAVDAIATDRDYAKVKLPYGLGPLTLVAKTPLRISVRLGERLTERVVAPTFLEPPIGKGKVLGRVKVYEGTALVGSRVLVASRAVHRAGVAQRVGWYASRTARDLASLFS